MFEDLMIFLLIVTGMGLTAWLVNRMIQTRHQLRMKADVPEAALLAENAGLKGQVGRLEQRIAVLETIATDPAQRTAREIESLR